MGYNLKNDESKGQIYGEKGLKSIDLENIKARKRNFLSTYCPSLLKIR